MWKQFGEFLLDLLNLARESRASKEAIVQLRGEVDELAGAVERLSYELRGLREAEQHEREKLVLRLENALLKVERQLSSAKDGRKSK